MGGASRPGPHGPQSLSSLYSIIEYGTQYGYRLYLSRQYLPVVCGVRRCLRCTPVCWNLTARPDRDAVLPPLSDEEFAIVCNERKKNVSPLTQKAHLRANLLSATYAHAMGRMHALDLALWRHVQSHGPLS